ncbi:ABC transporter ATP-binding protein, partial [Bordetella petrii]|nr:ABC transporter ATP-binding protein [Bordetella petrii]
EAPPAPRARATRAAKLSSWELRELEGLPQAIADIEARQSALSAQLADGSLYRDAPAEVERINKELAALETEMEEKFARWELLEARRADT